MLLISIFAFFFLITGLILIHEFGHFIAAKKAGVVVEEFGFGLPPQAKVLFRWRGTDFSLNWIPFGGFVRLKGESAVEDSERKQKGSFASASIPARCGILVAGVSMNFLLAIVIFFIGFSVGKWIPTYLSLEEMEAASERGEISMHLGVLIDEVLEGGTAAQAGITGATVITQVDGQEVARPSDVVDLQAGKTSVTYTLSAVGSEETREVTVPVEAGKTGLYLRAVPRELSAPMRDPVTATMLALRETKVVTVQTVLGIAKLFSSLAQKGTVPEGVTGIVGIAQLTYTSVQEGLMVYLRLVALLSLSLAVLNILPFPALDGGRLLFVLAELFVKPGNRRIELVTNTVGFGLLLLLIAIVTLYDVLRLFQ
jgi:regulator of sigma E protease